MTYPTLWRASRSLSPWSELFTFPTGADRLFDRFISGTPSLAVWSPAVDVRETENGIEVKAELPGLSSDDVTVTVENGVLSITGEKKHEIEEGEKGSEYHVVERRYGRFERAFTLPRGVDQEKVKARFDNGVLTVDLPKAEAAKPKQIAIK